VARAARVSTATVSRALSTPTYCPSDTRGGSGCDPDDRLPGQPGGAEPADAARGCGADPRPGSRQAVLFQDPRRDLRRVRRQRLCRADRRYREPPAAGRGSFWTISRRADRRGDLARRRASIPMRCRPASTRASAGGSCFSANGSRAADFPVIRADNAEGARLAVRHLHGLGHTRIAHVTGPEGNVLTVARRRGMLEERARLGLPTRAEWIIRGDFSLESGHRGGGADPGHGGTADRGLLRRRHGRLRPDRAAAGGGAIGAGRYLGRRLRRYRHVGVLRALAHHDPSGPPAPWTRGRGGAAAAAWTDGAGGRPRDAGRSGASWSATAPRRRPERKGPA
jgi:hypothetical protein